VFFPYDFIEGEFWRVSEDLAASRDLIVPRAPVDGPAPIAGGAYRTREGVTIIGIYYEILGNNVGFDLQAIDSVSTTTIIAPRTPAVANSRVCENITPCCIPLSVGGVDSPIASPAKLTLTLSGTPTGRVLIWGVYGTITGAFSRKAYTGSPTTFSW
jgi:hypothetical protein